MNMEQTLTPDDVKDVLGLVYSTNSEMNVLKNATGNDNNYSPTRGIKTNSISPDVVVNDIIKTVKATNPNIGSLSIPVPQAQNRQIVADERLGEFAIPESLPLIPLPDGYTQQYSQPPNVGIGNNPHTNQSPIPVAQPANIPVVKKFNNVEQLEFIFPLFTVDEFAQTKVGKHLIEEFKKINQKLDIINDRLLDVIIKKRKKKNANNPTPD